MDLMWPVRHPHLLSCRSTDILAQIFNDHPEQATNLCFAEVHGCCKPLIELITRCQEKVMLKDNQGLLRTLVEIKECVDQLSHVFHKISVNPGSGENFANPVVVRNLSPQSNSGHRILIFNSGGRNTPSGQHHYHQEFRQ